LILVLELLHRLYDLRDGQPTVSKRLCCWDYFVFCLEGQFECGAKRCMETEGLRSWEVNFAYVEHGEKKNALVKLRKLRVRTVLALFL